MREQKKDLIRERERETFKKEKGKKKKKGTVPSLVTLHITIE
jgi:hypothetical protein